MRSDVEQLQIRGICGWLGKTSPEDEPLLRNMAAALGDRTEPALTIGKDFAFASTDRWPLGRYGTGIVAITGYPELDTAANTLPSPASLDRLAEAWVRGGRDCLRDLRGAFALAAFDEATGRGLLAIDRIGQQPLYFAEHAGRTLFASTPAALIAFGGFVAKIDPQAVYEYLYFHMVPSPGCIYAGVAKLPGAHCLWADAGSPARLAPYWVPQFVETLDLPIAACHAELLKTIRAAMARHVANDDPGAFLSGGLDSSTVAGVLSELRPGGARSFSIGFRVAQYDESPFAQTAARWFHLQQHTHFLEPDEVLSAIPAIAAGCDEPFGNSSVLPAYFCARVAREHGVGILLGGDGGDELFAGNERYAKQLVFERYLAIPPLFRAALEKTVGALPGDSALIRKGRSFLRQAATPLPDRLQDYNYLHRFPVDEILEHDFLAQVDLQHPLRIQREIYDRPHYASPLNRMLYLDWQLTLADNDLRKVGRACELAGVEVRYPLLDDAVVEHSLRIPSSEKLRPGHLRHFYKVAMRGFLPPEVLTKRKHGFGLPFGVWLAEHPGLRALAYDCLGALKSRGYIRPGFIDRAIDMHSHGHAAYYGELVWVLMILELWLAAH